MPSISSWWCSPAYLCGVAMAGTVAIIEATFAKRTGSATAMALTAVTVVSLGAIVASLGKKKKGRTFGEDPGQD